MKKLFVTLYYSIFEPLIGVSLLIYVIFGEPKNNQILLIFISLFFLFNFAKRKFKNSIEKNENQKNSTDINDVKNDNIQNPEYEPYNHWKEDKEDKDERGLIKKNQIFKKYLTHNNEYISGKIYFYRVCFSILIFCFLSIINSFFVSLISDYINQNTSYWAYNKEVLFLIRLSLALIPSLYFIFINAYKRGISLKWDKITTIFGSIICSSYALFFSMYFFYSIDLQNLIFLGFFINVLLIFSNGKKIKS